MTSSQRSKGHVQITEMKIYQFQAKETSSTPQIMNFLYS